MSEPSREHPTISLEEVEAVNDFLNDGRELWQFLTSNDPRDWNAMQDALVRAGRLREEWSIPDGLAGLQRRTFGTEGMARRMAEMYGKRVSQRLVTEWQETKGGDDAEDDKE